MILVKKNIFSSSAWAPWEENLFLFIGGEDRCLDRNKEKEKGHLWAVEVGAKLEIQTGLAAATVQNSTLVSHGDFIPTHTHHVGTLQPGIEAQPGRQHVSWQEIGEVIKPVSSAGLLCSRQKWWYYLKMTCFCVYICTQTFMYTFYFSDIKKYIR